MKVVGHDTISQYICVDRLQIPEPFVKCLIRICHPNQIQPTVTGECDEICSVWSVYRVLYLHPARLRSLCEYEIAQGEGVSAMGKSL